LSSRGFEARMTPKNMRKSEFPERQSFWPA